MFKLALALMSAPRGRELFADLSPAQSDNVRLAIPFGKLGAIHILAEYHCLSQIKGEGILRLLLQPAGQLRYKVELHIVEHDVSTTPQQRVHIEEVDEHIGPSVSAVNKREIKLSRRCGGDLWQNPL